MVIRRAAFLVLTGAAGAAALKTYKDKDKVLLQLPFEKKSGTKDKETLSRTMYYTTRPT